MKRPSFARSYRAARKRIGAVDELVRVLDKVREDSGLSNAELARCIDATPEIVRRLFAEGANPSLRTVVEIASALGLEFRLVPLTRGGRRTAPKAQRSRSSEHRAAT